MVGMSTSSVLSELAFTTPTNPNPNAAAAEPTAKRSGVTKRPVIDNEHIVSLMFSAVWLSRRSGCNP